MRLGPKFLKSCILLLREMMKFLLCQLTHIDNLAGNFWVKYLYLSVELEVALVASILKFLHVHLDPSTNGYTHTAGNLKLYCYCFRDITVFTQYLFKFLARTRGVCWRIQSKTSHFIKFLSTTYW